MINENRLTEEDCEKLAQLDNISDVVKRLSCLDPTVSEKAIDEADKLLQNIEKGKGKTNVSRTVINRQSSPQNAGNGKLSGTDSNTKREETMSVEAFKAAVEADAAERSRRRAKNRARAEECKTRANEFFKIGDMENAIKMYSRAIEACRDWHVLYNNRAEAYLRAGRPEAALADCDMAMRLLPPEPQRAPTDVGDAAKVARDANNAAAKACLRRGKALLVLRRPRDALRAYADSRAFFALTAKPASARLPDPDADDHWPPYLVEPVAQVKAAIAADSLDSQSSAELTLSNNAQTLLLKPTEERFLRLITEAAMFGRDIRQYTSTLRQIAALLNVATVSTKPPSPNPPIAAESDLEESAQTSNGNGVSDREMTGVEDQIDVAPSPVQNGDIKNGQSKQQRQKRKSCAKNAQKSNSLNTPASPLKNGDSNAAAEVATLAKLQSYFRVRNGFTMLQSQMNRFDASEVIKLFRRPDGTPIPKTEKTTEELLGLVEHLLSLITVAYQLARDCGENQRLLVENMPKLFSTLLVDCLEVSPSSAQIPTSDSAAPEAAALQEVQVRHQLGLLQSVACDLLVLMSSEASGREGLLSHPGPATLLSALAACLSDALGLPSANAAATTRLRLASGDMRASPAARSVIGACFATQTVAAVAKILENITRSPHFLTLVRSTDCFVSLQSVVEAAAGRKATSTPVDCLSTLLDSLTAAASADPCLRSTLITKPHFISNLTRCAIRHVPHMVDEDHTELVCSLLRLLHNLLAGDRPRYLSREERQALLTLVGDLIDTPSSNSPTPLSLAIALLGRFLPHCDVDLVESWVHTGKDAPEMPKKKYSSTPRLKYRVQLLIDIVCTCSPSVLEEPASGLVSRVVKGAQRVSESPASMRGHRLRGAVRALAGVTRAPACGDVRIAIGDDRLVSRRLAGLLRARTAYPEGGAPAAPAQVERGAAGRASLPIDEVLVASVCLIMEACVADTVLAENLIGTPVVMDLLRIAGDAQSGLLRQNAGIVVARLAMASHVHREEASRLEATSRLVHFNSWSMASQTGRSTGVLF